LPGASSSLRSSTMLPPCSACAPHTAPAATPQLVHGPSLRQSAPGSSGVAHTLAASHTAGHTGCSTIILSGHNGQCIHGEASACHLLGRRQLWGRAHGVGHPDKTLDSVRCGAYHAPHTHVST